MILANSRDRFTANDFRFVVEVLGETGFSAASLTTLLTDNEARDSILDNPILREAIATNPAALSISSQFYFYISVRHALKDDGIENRKVADYVAAILSEFGTLEKMRSPAGDTGPLQYISNMLIKLGTAQPGEAFLIRAHLGNYSLFLSGLFHEFIQKRANRGAPDLAFYEGTGRCSFKVAADHTHARASDLVDVFELLSDEFVPVRKALNRMTERCLHLDDVPTEPIFN